MFHPTRRDAFATAAAFGLSFALPPMSARAAAARGAERKRSLLTVRLGGGPSQLETWDPHPDSPTGGPTRAIATTLPGVRIADGYPRVAEQLHHLSVVRSLSSREGDHERAAYHVATGFRPDPTVRHPALGAVFAHESPDPHLELPPFVSLGSSEWPGRGGYLGPGYDAFKVPDPGGDLANLAPRVDDARGERRAAALAVLENSFTLGRPGQLARTRHRETRGDALRMMHSEQLAAFELDDEPAERRAAYGDTTFGRGCLVARRLVETGVRAVEVHLGGFDTHADNFGGHATQAAILDPALAALVSDLADRDLLASTVLLVCGEFGRTPKVNALDGRDHWPKGFSCLLGGGGLRSGVLLGATDPAGEKPPTDPLDIPDLAATVFAALNVDHTREEITPIGRPLPLSEGTPRRELLRS